MPSIRQSIRSSTASKRPTSAIADGQIALNTASGTPGIFFKDSAGNIVKAGPAHYGATAPNSSPAVGGSTGNSIGEAWLDVSLTPAGWKIWNGSAWVNATPLSSDTVQGLVELATNAETQAGVDAARAVTAASLQSKVSDSISTTSASGIASSTAVKTAYDLANAALPKSGGIVTGNLEIGSTGSFTFEGATADGFETTLAVVDPTTDRTITFPNITGTVVTTGDTGTVTSTMILDGTILDADINASAAIAFSKLASLASARILVGNASGVPTSTVVTGDVTITNAGVTAIASNVIVNADINSAAAIAYSKLALASGIVNTDVSASAAIAGTKISPDFGSQNLTTTGNITATNHIAASGTATTPSIQVGNGTTYKPGIYSPGTDQLAISTGGTGRLFVDANGRLGIGSTSPTAKLTCTSTVQVTGFDNPSGGAGLELGYDGTSSIIQSFNRGTSAYKELLLSANSVQMSIAGGEAARIDSSRRLLVGTSTARSNFYNTTNTAQFQLEGTNFQNASASLTCNANNTFDTSVLVFARSNGASIGSNTLVTNNTYLGAVSFMGNDGTEFVKGAEITAEVDGTPGANDMPGRLVFSTTADGASSPTERMRITSAGLVGLGTSSPGSPLDVFGGGIRSTDSAGNARSRLEVFTNGQTNNQITLGQGFGGPTDNVGYLYNRANAALVIGTNDAERLRVTSGGLVGIGTSSPGTALDVNGTINVRTNGYEFGRITTNNNSANQGGLTFQYNNTGTFTTGITLNYAGNVGIGTTSPGFVVHAYRSTAVETSYCAQNSVTTSVFGTSSAGNTFVYNDGAYPIQFFTNNAERGRWTGDGKLLVGTSTNAGNGLLQVRNDSGGVCYDAFRAVATADGAPVFRFNKSRGTSASPTEVNSGDVLGYIAFSGYDGAAFADAAYITAIADGTWTDGGDTTDNPGALVFSTMADGAASITERMRIKENGDILWGATSAVSSATTGFQVRISDNTFRNSVGTTSNVNQAIFFNPNGIVGSITTNGSATAYNTSSDYRLKENVVPLTGAADRLNQLQVHRFNFIADPDKTVDGFIAHEAQAVVPECVTGVKDEVDEYDNPVYQGIDQAKLVPLLTAALQEAIAKIEALETRLSALEGN